MNRKLTQQEFSISGRLDVCADRGKWLLNTLLGPRQVLLNLAQWTAHHTDRPGPHPAERRNLASFCSLPLSPTKQNS